MKLLLVDDAAFMRLILKNICIEEGYQIVGEAANGEEAVRKFIRLSPDIVIMDIVMPDMDGIQCIKEVLQIDQNAKIIMCSAMGQRNYVIKCIQAGAKDFIVKPFDKKTVIDIIRRVL